MENLFYLDLGVRIGCGYASDMGIQFSQDFHVFEEFLGDHIPCPCLNTCVLYMGVGHGYLKKNVESGYHSGKPQLSMSLQLI